MNNHLSRFFVFMTLLLLSVALYGSSEIQIDDYTQRVDITKNSEVFIDAQDHFDFKEVSGEIFNNNFEPAGTTAVFAKSIKDSVWIRFKLVNETDSLFLGKIELPLYWLHKIGIYLKDGSSAMLGEKEMKGRSFFIPVEIEPRQSAFVYMKAKSENGFVFAPVLYSQKEWLERATYISMLNGVLIGIVLIMLFYNIYNYLTFRENNYVYYILYLLGMLFMLGLHYGFAPELFWNKNGVLGEKTYYLLISFAYISAILFARNFLNTQKEMPKSEKYSMVLAALAMVIGVFGLISGSTIVTQYAVLIYSVLFFVFLTFISAASIKKGLSGSRSLTLGWLFLGAGQLAVLMMNIGIIGYHDFIYDIYAVTVAANILMISFALVSRLKDEETQFELEAKKEHEIADRLNLSKKELRELSKKLQIKVDKQEKELHAKEMEYEKFSTKDELTNIYNKSKLEDMLTNELHRAKRYNYTFSIILANIDSLSSINEVHGQEVGNSVIKETADIFMRHIRYLDIVGRWSETEYLIICPQTNASQAFTAAEHLQSLVEKYKFFFVGKATSSFGVTDYRADDTMQEIMKRAYEALAKAKEDGRNRVEAL